MYRLCRRRCGTNAPASYYAFGVPRLGKRFVGVPGGQTTAGHDGRYHLCRDGGTHRSGYRTLARALLRAIAWNHRAWFRRTAGARIEQSGGIELVVKGGEGVLPFPIKRTRTAVARAAWNASTSSVCAYGRVLVAGREQGSRDIADSAWVRMGLSAVVDGARARAAVGRRAASLSGPPSARPCPCVHGLTSSGPPYGVIVNPWRGIAGGASAGP